MSNEATEEATEPEFQLWEFTDYVSRCFARRTQEQVREEYYDMVVGEQRQLHNPDYWIIRTK